MRNTILRCFRRRRDDDGRCGIWLMLDEYTGEFFHGDREEVQVTRHMTSELERWAKTGRGYLGGVIEEVTPEQVLKELESWPEGREYVDKLFERYSRNVEKAEMSQRV